MESERDSLDGSIMLVVMSGIVIATFANESYESVRCLGLIVGFGVLFAALGYGAWRER